MICPNGGKRAFQTEQAARKHRTRATGARLFVYQCPYGKHWHLTHSPQK